MRSSPKKDSEFLVKDSLARRKSFEADTSRSLVSLANNKLLKDKQESKEKIKSSSGISYILDGNIPSLRSNETEELLSALGYQEKHFRKLPKSLTQFKEISSISQAVTLRGLPGRSDVKKLSGWLTKMLGELLSDENSDLKEISKGALAIYEVCFNEIVRQVKLSCKERGEFIEQVWLGYVKLIEKTTELSQNHVEMAVKRHQDDKLESTKWYTREIQRLNKENRKNSLEYQKTLRELEWSNKRFNEIAKKNIFLESELEKNKSENNDLSIENSKLQERNNIIYGLLENEHNEFVAKPRRSNVRFKTHGPEDIDHSLK